MGSRLHIINNKELLNNNVDDDTCAHIREKFEHEVMIDENIELACKSCGITKAQYMELAVAIIAEWKFKDLPDSEWTKNHFISVLRYKSTVINLLIMAKTIKEIMQQAIRLQTQPSIPPTLVDLSKEMEFFRAAFFKVEPGFTPDLTDKDILNSLFAWVWKLDKYNKLKFDYNKGFCFYGDLGLGKSMILQALRLYRNSLVARHESKREDFRMKGTWLKSASELANIFSADGQSALIQYTSDEINLIIDELGREPRPAKYFGTELNVIQFVLQLRYDHRRDSVTHITTNLKPEDIGQYYGEYIADRCWEMFNFIEFKGASLRSKAF